MYLGFSDLLPVDRVGLFFDVVEQPDDMAGPRCAGSIGTAANGMVLGRGRYGAYVPGLVRLIARTTASVCALRCRCTGCARRGRTAGRSANAIFLPNAVWAVQYQTVVDEPLGASTGSESGIRVSADSVLAGTRVEVREVRAAALPSVATHRARAFRQRRRRARVDRGAARC
jgi:hypothetical protein